MSAIKYDPDPETLAEVKAWLAERPQIANVFWKFSPFHCYRLKDHNPRGHYSIYSYSDDGTVTLVHGADSTLPGVGTFGQDPENLIVCDCGKFEHADEDQVKASPDYIDSVAVYYIDSVTTRGPKI